MLKFTRRIALLLAIGLFAVGSLWAQSNRATITGVITDQSGAVMSGVSVTATNTATGISTPTKSGGGGAFTIPLLEVGPYQVTAEFRGFKKYVQTGIVLDVGQTVPLDIRMQLGAVTETVQVTAQPLLAKDTTMRDTVVTATDIEELPIVSQSEQRNPGFFIELVPGVHSYGTSNGTASGSGRQLDTVVNGSQSGSTEFQLDGVTIVEPGEMSGDFHPLVFPPEAVGEFQVMTLNPPAQYGAAEEAIEAFTLKSGTNPLHAQAFENIRNEDLDATNFFTNAAPQNCNAHGDPVPPSPGPAVKACRSLNKQNEFGVTVGGPIVFPHIYNGRDKTFFFGWYHGYRFAAVGNSARDTLPTASMRGGDESNILGAQIGIAACGTTGALTPCYDALGRPVYTDAIYDPGTERTVAPGAVDPVTGLTNTTGNAALIRDPFGASAANGWMPSNIIPTTRQDPLAQKIFGYFANPPACATCLDGYILNWIAGYPTNASINDYGGKVDHNIGANDRLMGDYVWWHDYAPTGSKWPGAITEGSNSYTQNDIARLSEDHIFSPTLVNHAVIGFNRSRNDSYPGAGTGWPAKLGYSGVPQTGPGSVFIEMDIGGLGNTYARQGQGYSATNDWNAEDNITWSKNRHTVKAGFSWTRMGLNQFGSTYQSSYLRFTAGGTELAGPWYNEGCGVGGGNTSGSGGCNGFGAASFLMGVVDYGQAGINTAITGSRVGHYAGYLQDDIKWSPKLTFNLGLRYDLMLPVVDAHNFFSWSDPAVENTDLGIKGAQVWATRNRRSPALTTKGAFGPRIGIAYAYNDKTVIRTSYGILYAAGGSERIQGGSFSELGYSEINPVITDTSTGYSGLIGGTVSGHSDYHMTLSGGWPIQFFPVPPFINQSLTVGQGPPSFGAWPGDGNLPSMQNYTLDVQRQMRGGIVLDVAYVGTQGRHLPSRLMNSNVMPTQYAIGSSMLYTNASGALSNYIQSPLVSDGLDANGNPNSTIPNIQGLPVVQHMPLVLGTDQYGNPMMVHAPYAGFQNTWGTTVALGQALRPFPQWTTDTVEGLSQLRDFSEVVGRSSYNALQVQARKHFSSGLSFLVSYSYSKTITNAGAAFNEFGGFTQDFYNAKGERSLSINDYPNNVVLSYEYEFPFGPGKRFANVHGPAGKVIGGWIISGVQSYVSGPPDTVSYGGGAPGYPYAGDTSFSARANVVPGVQKKSVAILTHRFDPNGTPLRNDGKPCSQVATSSNPCNYSNAYDPGTLWNGAAWSAPAPWTFGGAPVYDGSARRFGYHNEDISLIKRTAISERFNVELRADFLNIFNRTLFGFDQGGDQYGQLIGGGSIGGGIGGFGHPSGQANFPREIQFGLKLTY